MKAPFERIYHDEDYEDFEFYLPDSCGFGGRLRIDLRLGGKDRLPISAFMIVYGDTVDDGEEVFWESFDIPLEWALAMVGKGEGDVNKCR